MPWTMENWRWKKSRTTDSWFLSTHKNRDCWNWRMRKLLRSSNNLSWRQENLLRHDWPMAKKSWWLPEGLQVYALVYASWWGMPRNIWVLEYGWHFFVYLFFAKKKNIFCDKKKTKFPKNICFFSKYIIIVRRNGEFFKRNEESNPLYYYFFHTNLLHKTKIFEKVKRIVFFCCQP